VNAATGATALTGQAAGDCTVKATSSLGGSATKLVTISTKVLNTVNCLPSAPRPGDALGESIGQRSNAYGFPRVNSSYQTAGQDTAPDNPIFRDMAKAQATYTYTAGAGSLVNLNVTGLTKTGAAAYPAPPAAAWDAAVPLPIWSGFTNAQNPNGASTYVFNADGSINSAPKYTATTDSGGKISQNTTKIPVQEYLNSAGAITDWQRAFAAKRDADGTVAGSNVNLTQTITVRQTGGWLPQLQFAVSGGSTGGASYRELRFNVTAKFEGFAAIPTAAPTVGYKGGASGVSNPVMDSAGATLSTANGKLQYGNMCKFSYTFTKLGATATGTAQQAAEATAWDGAAQVKADTTVTCTGWCTSSLGGNDSNKVRNAQAAAIGDWTGTFYTHDQIPRVVKNYRTAIGKSGGQAAVTGGQKAANGAADYYAMREGGSQNTSTETPSNSPSNPTSGGTTVWTTSPPSNQDEMVTAVTRLVLP
jgi:hypothetical protein